MSSYAGSPPAARPGESGPLRLLAYLALAVALLVLDHRGGWLAWARDQAAVLVQPLRTVAGLPGTLRGSLQDGLATRTGLIEENRRRSKLEREFELIDTGIFDDDRYFDITIEYAKAGPEDICVRITAENRGSEAASSQENLWRLGAGVPRL